MTTPLEARRQWTAAHETPSHKLVSIQNAGREVFHITVDRRVVVSGTDLEVVAALDAMDPDHGLPLVGLTAQEAAESWVRCRYMGDA